jgi:hypothetical protein
LEVVASDQHYAQVKEGLQQENVQLKFKDYKLEEDGILLFRDKVYVPNTQELRNIVLKEMHNVPYVGHPGYQEDNCSSKKPIFLAWNEENVVDYIARCMECQKVKTEHSIQQDCYNHFPFLNGNGR